MPSFSDENLRCSFNALGIEPPAGLFEQLYAAYTEAGRYYHTDRHVTECLTVFAAVRDQAEHPAEIDVAIWFHDAVYDTHKSDNEAQSAAWAQAVLDAAGASGDTSRRISQLILATRTHEANDADARLMLDVDLAILGTPEPTFEAYDAAIRQEYAWVPEAQYRSGRGRILQDFLDRAAIFRTAHFHDRYEAQARVNLQRKIVELTAL